MNLAEIRKEKNMTQQELADLIKVKRQTISAIENGVNPKIETAKKIAKVLGFEWTKFYEAAKQAS